MNVHERFIVGPPLPRKLRRFLQRKVRAAYPGWQVIGAAVFEDPDWFTVQLHRRGDWMQARVERPKGEEEE